MIKIPKLSQNYLSNIRENAEKLSIIMKPDHLSEVFIFLIINIIMERIISFNP